MAAERDGARSDGLRRKKPLRPRSEKRRKQGKATGLKRTGFKKKDPREIWGRKGRTSDQQTSAEAGEKPKKPKRSYQKKRAGVYGPYHRWIQTFPCLGSQRILGHRCWGAVTGHHLKTVGSGGRDFANEIPLCEGLHTELHTIGHERFAERHGLSREDMEIVAHQLAERWRREDRGPPGTRGEVRRGEIEEGF